jgi:hypothetical protein
MRSAPFYIFIPISANAKRQGIPCKSFGFKPSGVFGRMAIAPAGFFITCPVTTIAARIAVTNIQPQCTIITQYTFQFIKYRHKIVDKFLQ